MPTWTTIGTSTLTPVEMTKRKEVLVPLRRTDYTLLYHYGDLDKTPMRGVSYLATFVNGETRGGTLDDKGQAQMCAVPAGAVTVSYQHEAANTDDANIIAARDKIRKALDAIVAQTRTDMAREWQRWNEAGWLKRQYLETLKTSEGRTLGAWHWLSGTLEAVWQLAVLCCKLDKEELELAYLFSTGQWRALDEKIAGYRKKGHQMLAEASEAKELLNLVFHDQQTRTLITEFAKKWWEAIPPHERDEMLMDSGTQIIIDVVIGVLLAAFSAGAAGEAYGSAKWTAAGGRLGVRVRELLDALKDAFEALAKALKLRKRGMTEVTREANAERVIESKWKPEASLVNTTAEKAAELKKRIGADIKNHPLRQAYESEVAGLAQKSEKLLESGMSKKDVAHQLWQKRRDLGVKYKNVTPKPLRDFIYEVNETRYQDPLGPKFEDLIANQLDKGASLEDAYQKIINTSSTPNSDVNKLLLRFEEWLCGKDQNYLDKALTEFGE